MSASSERRDFHSFPAGFYMPPRRYPLSFILMVIAALGAWFGVVYVGRVTARTAWMVSCVRELEPSAGRDAAVQLCAVQR